MDVVVPDLGDFSEVEVIEVLVTAGDSVSAEDPLITLETDKAAMDVPSPAGGVLKEIKVSVGDKLSSGDVIALLDESNGAESAGGERADTAPKDVAPADEGPEQTSTQAESEAKAEEAGPAAAAAAEPQSVTVPDLGDFSDVEIIEVLVAEGETVEAEQGLVTLETEKATMDVPAPVAGRIVELKVDLGSRVNTGTEIAVLEPVAAAEPVASEPKSSAAGASAAVAEAGGARNGAGAPEAAEPAKPAAVEAPRRARGSGGTVRSMPPIDERSFSTAHASPSVRKLARELGVDLGRVAGSGRKGRVTADDVKAFVKQMLEAGPGAGIAWPEVPEVDFAQYGEIEVEPVSRIQKIAGPRLHASWVNLPHVTQHDEADITDLENTRSELKGKASERGIKLTPLAFILRALVLTLNEFERFKASLTPDGENLVMKKYTHLGFAADTPNGLVVPVIRDAERKDVYELATSLGELSERARAGKLKAADMQGGVFTVSSLGGIGGTFFTPIIVAPEVAILGVSKAQWKPVYNGSEFVPRLMLPLSLSYDHRVIDGAEAVRFTTRLGEMLADVERILEAIP